MLFVPNRSLGTDIVDGCEQKPRSALRSTEKRSTALKKANEQRHLCVDPLSVPIGDICLYIRWLLTVHNPSSRASQTRNRVKVLAMGWGLGMLATFQYCTTSVDCAYDLDRPAKPVISISSLLFSSLY